jgi:hypothetical protein
VSPRHRCNAVFVVLGETPELDRLERCVADPCGHHVVELEWVRRNPDRLARYNEQLHRYDLGQQLAAQAEQETML